MMLYLYVKTAIFGYWFIINKSDTESILNLISTIVE